MRTKTNKELEELAKELSGNDLAYLIAECIRNEGLKKWKFECVDFKNKEYVWGTVKRKERF